MKKTLQYFTKEYLDQCKGMSTEQILEFLENYRMLVTEFSEKCQPISIKIEPSLLKAFKQKARLENIPYQTMIKQLMRDWLS